jgi:site-specific recombinase XerD
MCGPCWQRDEGRAQIRGDHLLEELADPPVWLPDFVDYLADRHCPARAAVMIGLLAKLLNDENPNNPQAVLERGRRPGRSMGSLARAMQDFFVERGLALPTDQAERLAAGRRQRRIDAVPAPLRPAVQAFSTEMMKNKQRARAAATRPRSDQTIEMTLGALRDLAVFLDSHRGKSDWSLVNVHDLEAFVDALPKTRSHSISLLRQFFRFARSRRIVLVDPTRGLTRNAPRGFTGQTLTLNKQRHLFRRWTSDPAVHPHEALMGLLALLHGASGAEVRMLCSDDIDPIHRSIRLAQRPQPVPMDPASWSALQHCLLHRESQHTRNPHVVVTRGTKAGKQAASTAYFSHLLDPSGVTARTVRCTRLVALVNTIDPKLVAAAFGMDTQGVMFYLADRVDDARLPTATTNQ